MLPQRPRRPFSRDHQQQQEEEENERKQAAQQTPDEKRCGRAWREERRRRRRQCCCCFCCCCLPEHHRQCCWRGACRRRRQQQQRSAAASECPSSRAASPRETSAGRFWAGPFGEPTSLFIFLLRVFEREFALISFRFHWNFFSCSALSMRSEKRKKNIDRSRASTSKRNEKKNALHLSLSAQLHTWIIVRHPDTSRQVFLFSGALWGERSKHRGKQKALSFFSFSLVCSCCPPSTSTANKERERESFVGNDDAFIYRCSFATLGHEHAHAHASPELPLPGTALKRTSDDAGERERTREDEKEKKKKRCK